MFFKGKKNKNNKKEESEKFLRREKTKETMRGEFENVILKKETKSLTEQIMDMQVQLNALNRKYNRIIESELQIAKAKQKPGVLPYNQVKIGISYYCLYLIDEISMRLNDMTTTAELNDAMGGMQKIIQGVNRLDAKVGGVDTQKLEKEFKKEIQFTEARVYNLGDTLERVVCMLEKNAKVSKNSIEKYVNNEVIEKLIKGEVEVEECIQTQDGIKMDMDMLYSEALKEIPEESHIVDSSNTVSPSEKNSYDTMLQGEAVGKANVNKEDSRESLQQIHKKHYKKDKN